MLITNIRMPSAFQREGIDAAKEIHKRQPKTGVAVLSQYQDLEYTLVRDTVNLSQRLQQLAMAGETVVCEATLKALSVKVETVPLGAQQVKARDTPVVAYTIMNQSGKGASLPEPYRPPGQVAAVTT